VYTKEKILLG